MHNQPETAHAGLEALLMELADYTALLDDLTARKCADDTTLTSDGLNGLNRLLRHLRGLSVEALGTVPTR